MSYTSTEILKAHKALCFSRGYTKKVVGAYDYETKRLYKGKRNHCRLWGSKDHGELMDIYDSKIGERELIPVKKWLPKYQQTLS
jgi:hypothetical protein